MFYLGGVQFSVVAAVLLASTFVPRGAWCFNPKLSEERSEAPDAEEAVGVSGETRVSVNVVDLNGKGQD